MPFLIRSGHLNFAVCFGEIRSTCPRSLETFQSKHDSTCPRDAFLWAIGPNKILAEIRRRNLTGRFFISLHEKEYKP